MSYIGLGGILLHFLKKSIEPPPFAQPVQTSFVQNRIEPIGKTSLKIELIQMLIDLNKGLLAGIFGILTVSQDVHGHGHRFAPVFVHDFLVLLYISTKTAL